ncbi:hypothetical protein SASPL_142244 [Salvia splendens]|uniref:TPX2 C-terminal domain-containing protein n=1 Tax=Salvia splendens TaxID=180675 RepID=A0A8X8WIV4_SALSN|nr:uncharacterized protein LOC121770082 [Salvia splendens]KAG6396105.1 hypothetical protein SASPL_142244 [Salvia splendens]
MDSSSKSGGPVTPAKEKIARSKSENVNPNVKFSNSPLITKSERSAKKSASRNATSNPKQLIVASPSPKKKIRERKFVIAKKRVRNQDQSSLGAAAGACEKCKKATGKLKCLCVAYESLRASQEVFFKNRDEIEDEVSDKLEDFDLMSLKEGLNAEGRLEGDGALSEINRENKVDFDGSTENDDGGVKRSRDRLLEEAKVRVRTPGSGRVMNLVKEFEKLTTFKLGNSEENDVEEAENDEVGTDLASSGLEPPPKAPETQVSSSSFCPSIFQLTSESLGLDPRRSYSLDSNDGSSVATMTTAGGQKSRRRSTESAANRTRRLWKRKQRKVTSLKPFMLRTEERGKCKEEVFMKKLQQMIEEEEKMKVPIAQGLPWTTDEPEYLVKPPVKEVTRPVDLVLHSDVRAVDRSEFDHQIAMKMNMVEQYRLERERQQKEAEEEEIRRLRKELIPKAQPMPYFDRPFVPRRSEKNPTIPKEPKFNLPQQKKTKCNLSLDDFVAHCQ